MEVYEKSGSIWRIRHSVNNVKYVRCEFDQSSGPYLALQKTALSVGIGFSTDWAPQRCTIAN